MARGKRQSFRGKRFIVYIRVSMVGDRGEDLISDDIQLAECRRWEAREGATIVDVVVDLDESGRSFDKRKILNTLNRIKAGEADGVLLWKVSRFGRNLVDSLLNIRDLVKFGGAIGSASENLDDIESAMGKFSLTQMLAIAELQSDMIGETWVNIHDYRRGNGLPHTGGPRFGYDFHRGEKDPAKVYTISPTTGPWLAKAYREFTAGKSVTKLCEEMWNAGIRSVKGGRIVYNSLLNTLDTGFGAGLIVDRRESQSRTNSPSEWTYQPGAHDGVITELEWEAYLAKRADRRAPREKAAAHKLTGLVKCGSCCRASRRTNRPRTGGRRVIQFECNLRHRKNLTTKPCPAPFTMTQDELEEQVFRWLVDHCDGDDALEAAMARKAKAATARADVEGVEREIERLTKRLSRATDMALDEDDPDARQAFREKAAELRTEVRQLERQRDELGAEVKVMDMPSLDAFSALVAAWDRMDLAMLNEALRTVVGGVYVLPGPRGAIGRVRIYGRWEELPESPELELV
jgi:site-specific DNA recombinase